MNLINWILSHPATEIALILSILEIFLRLKPTAKNYSLIDKIHRILNVILPNVKDKATGDRVTQDLNKVNDLLKVINKFEIK